MAITGVHALMYTEQPEAVRAFLRDVLDWPYVDVHDGWLIFAMPPAEVGVHPVEAGGAAHELWLMCDDIDATVGDLRTKGVEVSDPAPAGFGTMARITLPDGNPLSIYQASHPSPLG